MIGGKEISIGKKKGLTHIIICTKVNSRHSSFDWKKETIKIPEYINKHLNNLVAVKDLKCVDSVAERKGLIMSLTTENYITCEQQN